MMMVKATSLVRNFEHIYTIYRRSLNVMRFRFGYRWCSTPILSFITVHQTTNTTLRCRIVSFRFVVMVHPFSVALFVCVCLSRTLCDIHTLSHVSYALLSTHSVIIHLSLSHPLYATIHSHSNGKCYWQRIEKLNAQCACYTSVIL